MGIFKPLLLLTGENEGIVFAFTQQ